VIFRGLSIFDTGVSLQALKNEALGAWARAPWRSEADCLFCGAASDSAACAACVDALPRIARPCPRCGLALEERGPCGRCVQRVPPFDAVAARFAYRFPIDRAVLRFKFAGDLAMGRWLALELAAHVEGRERPQLLVAPPTTRERLARRGFDPALEVARRIGRRLGVKCDPGAVARLRDTAHQPGLTRRSRRANLRGAFRCTRDLRGLHVAVVDDVVTSGATAEAMAIALREAGAARVEVWAVARTPQPGG